VLSDTILKGTHPGTIPARFGLIWFSGFRGEDLNVIFYQNMPNLHNRVPFKIVSDSPALHSRWLLLLKIEISSIVHCSNGQLKFHLPLFSIFSLAAILVGSRDHPTQFWKGVIQGPFHQNLVQIGPVASEELIKM
jgi:hypothetical protein